MCAFLMGREWGDTVLLRLREFPWGPAGPTSSANPPTLLPGLSRTLTSLLLSLTTGQKKPQNIGNISVSRLVCQLSVPLFWPLRNWDLSFLSRVLIMWIIPCKTTMMLCQSVCGGTDKNKLECRSLVNDKNEHDYLLLTVRRGLSTGTC